MNSRITSAFNEGITGARTTKTLVTEEKTTEQFRGLFVGEVPAAAEDALLERPRAVGTQERLPVVVEFEHERFAAREAAADGGRRFAQVRREAESDAGRRTQDEPDGIGRVVRDFERLDLEFAERERFARREHGEVPFQVRLLAASVAFDRRGGGVRRVDRHARPALDHGKRRDVVRVAVRDEDGLHVAERAADRGEAFAHAGTPQSRVHEDPGRAAFDVGAVALAAAGEDGERQAGRWRFVW